MIRLDPDLRLAFRLIGRCQWCGKLGPTVGHHYWYRKGMGGGSQIDHPFNLIALDALCHTLVHDGHISKYGLLAKVAAREGVLQDCIIATLLAIRNAPRRGIQ